MTFPFPIALLFFSARAAYQSSREESGGVLPVELYSDEEVEFA
jgi:hypothetical protein